MEFIGRDKEIKKFLDFFKDDNQTAALIYGRRRVGKSELIKYCIKNSGITSIYYECKQTTGKNNAESISQVIADYLNIPKPDFNSVEEVADYLFRRFTDEYGIFVLDEYPYLRENTVGLDSIMQSLIDKYKNKSKLKIIVCGSSVETMKTLLKEDNPLYGRIDLTVSLEPMDYYDSSKFYENFSDEDKIRIYSVFGGIPYYNRLINDKLSVKENIIKLIASSGARLENEISMFLHAELSKITNANEVFETMAKGYSKFSDILSQSHVSSSPTLVDVLEKLEKLQIVGKESPINDKNNKKKTRYFISDNLSLFYYKYIFVNMSQMKMMDEEEFYNRYIHEDFETKYVPKQFERIAKQYLIMKNKKGELKPVITEIGKYWYDDPKGQKNGEFDIVTKDDAGYIFYEVKFSSNPLSYEIVRKEIEQVKECGLDCYKYGFISRSGFENFNDDNVIKINLTDLYK